MQKFAKSLLDVADNLSRAVGAVDAPDDSTDPQLKVLLEGVQMTDAQVRPDHPPTYPTHTPNLSFIPPCMMTNHYLFLFFIGYYLSSIIH